MDISDYLQRFENSFSAYTGDDPLDPWDKFVDYLEQRMPERDNPGMSQVFDSLVQRFLNVERYTDDVRFVNYCIKCASFYPEPDALYSHVYSKGVGHRTAALYLAWAQQLEHRGMLEQADSVYQQAVKNQAQPAETILNEYRQFQTRAINQTSVSESRNASQNVQLPTQMTSHQEHQDKVSVECSLEPPTIKTIITVSRSESSGSSQSANVQFVSEYLKEELVCEGSELCFEEVRAAKYFRQVKAQQEDRTSKQLFVKEVVEKNKLLDLAQKMEAVGQTLSWGAEVDGPGRQTTEMEAALNLKASQQAQRSCSRGSLGLRLATEPAFIREAPAVAPGDHGGQGHATSEPVERPGPPVLNASSVPLAARQMTPPPQEVSSCADNRVLQEDLETSGAAQDQLRLRDPEDKLNMSQGGTGNLSHVTPNTSLGLVQATPSRVLPSPTVNTREALNVIMDMFQAPTLLEDLSGNPSAFAPSEMEAEPASPKHGVRSLAQPPAAAAFTIFQDDQDKENSSVAAPHPALRAKAVTALAEIPLAKKPNDTAPDLMPDESTMWGARYDSLRSLAACPNSTTDFAMLAQLVSTPSACKTPHSSNFFQDEENSGGDGDYALMTRQSKKLSPIMEQSPADETAGSQLGPPSHRLGTIVGEALCSTSSSTMVQAPPPGVLSFRDQTVCTGTTLNPEPEQPPKPESPPPAKSQAFQILEDAEEAGGDPVCDASIGLGGPDWLTIRSPEVPPESDLDAFLSPCRLTAADVPMTPEPASPDRGRCLDVSMNSATPTRASGAPLVSDPWDDRLISRLLSALTPPLSSHPHYTSWPFDIPAISPRMSISMGSACLRVDCVLGEGAFATVYQATDPATSEKVVLKVQKAASPWEFYIDTQLDARLPPATRHLFSNVRSAHLFNDGIVLLAELHQYGTLLNAVNIYKSLSEKVMPQPLVMYFTTCILSMVEQLHAISIVHADIKPDNFLLGERFLENQRLDPESLDHGLVLIDLGQSVDMALFPEGTAFTGRCLTSGFQCTEMLSGRPWNYQTDYFGVAGTVHCMLFGTYMQVTNDGGVWKTNGVFRRIPHSELWQEFFHVLLNVPDCSSPPSLAHLRRALSSVLQQNYSSKLRTLKSRLLVQLLERRK